MSTTNTDRIKVRWRKGWAAIPNAVLRDKRLSRNARLLWCVLASYAGNEETAWPDQERLAQDCAEDDTVPNVRSIQRWIKELEAMTWLTRHRTRYGNEYELHEPVNDSGVASDPTVVSHQTRHTDRVTPDSRVASDPTHGSDPLKNKTHGSKLKEQESPSSAAAADGAGAPGDDDGGSPLADWLKREFLIITAERFSAYPDAATRAYVQRLHDGGANAAMIAADLAKPATRRMLASTPPPPPPATDERRPDWIAPEQWQSLTDPQRDALALAQLVDGRIEARYPDLTESIYKRWSPTVQRLIQAVGEGL